jgi:hypothetical protein
VSLEDEVRQIADRGSDPDSEDALDEQRLARQSELVTILRKHKIATVPIYKGEGLFAARMRGWIISDYRPGGQETPSQHGEMIEPALEIFVVALCSDGICYAFRRPGKPRRRGGRRLMMGPAGPLRQHLQQEIAIRAKTGTFSATGAGWQHEVGANRAPGTSE